VGTNPAAFTPLFFPLFSTWKICCVKQRKGRE
jgi:hypothetical protein